MRVPNLQQLQLYVFMGGTLAESRWLAAGERTRTDPCACHSATRAATSPSPGTAWLAAVPGCLVTQRGEMGLNQADYTALRTHLTTLPAFIVRRIHDWLPDHSLVLRCVERGDILHTIDPAIYLCMVEGKNNLNMRRERNRESTKKNKKIIRLALAPSMSNMRPPTRRDVQQPLRSRTCFGSAPHWGKPTRHLNPTVHIYEQSQTTCSDPVGIELI